MTEVRGAPLPKAEPICSRRASVSFPDASFRPLLRGLLFLAALSLPVLGCVTADRFHGSASGSAQVAAAPRIPPRSRAAANPLNLTEARFAPAKLGQSLSLR